MLQRNVMELPVSQIAANPDQPRKTFNEEQLLDLTKSIAQYGVLQPIIVSRGGDGKFYIIAGERRYRAATLAGLKKIPAVIKEISRQDADIISLVENIQREGLSYIEEAKAYKTLIEKYNLTQGEIAASVGKKQSTISNKLRILSLPEDLQEVMVAGNLTERHARAILVVEDNGLRKKIVEKIIKNGLNVRQSEKLIKEILDKERKSKAVRRGYVNYKIYVNSFKKVFNEVRKINNSIKMEENYNNDYVELVIRFPKEDRCFT